MHEAAMRWVAEHVTGERVSVLDIGGRDINGSVRSLFVDPLDYVSIDLLDGPGVDVIGDVREWTDGRLFDVVVCCEVLEHAAEWREVLHAAAARLRDGGRIILTAAGPGREPHSGIDGSWQLRGGEHYCNIEPDALAAALLDAGFVEVVVDAQDRDVRAVGRRA